MSNWFTNISNLLKADKKDNSTGDYKNQRQEFRTFKDLKDLEDAIAQAENVDNPQRVELHQIFDMVELDPHYKAQWETRKLKTIERDWGLYVDEEKNDEATEMLNKDWFYDFMHLAMDVKKRGYILIEFGKVENDSIHSYRDSKGRLHKPVEHVLHRHVSPEYGELLKNDTDYRGADLFKPPWSVNTLFLGDGSNFGLSRDVAGHVLMKMNCVQNWSEWAEIFGHDVRFAKSSAKGKARANLLKALKQIGSGAVGVFDPDDEIEYRGTNRTDAYLVYKEFIEAVNSDISKLIFGQDVIMDQTGRVRGTAAENITNMIGEADAKHLASVINNQLLPKLRKLGINIPEGVVFRWDTSENLSLTERVDIDLKISQMGNAIDVEYLQETYGVVISEEDVQNPEQVAERLKQLYGGSK